MFFILSKILSFIISPIFWIFSLMISAIFVKVDKSKKRLFFLSFLIFIFFSNSFIFNEFIYSWEVPATRLAEMDTCEIGIVLGGMVNYDSNIDRPQFQRGVDRLLQAVELYRKGFIKKILFVGGSGSIEFPENKEAIYAKRFLLYFGISEHNIIIETESRNTHENALFSKKILEEEGVKGKSILITSGFHMKRALGCFFKEGISVIPYSTDRYGGARKFSLDHLFIPNVGALIGWDLYIHELVGYLTYYLSGYL